MRDKAGMVEKKLSDTSTPRAVADEQAVEVSEAACGPEGKIKCKRGIANQFAAFFGHQQVGRRLPCVQKRYEIVLAEMRSRLFERRMLPDQIQQRCGVRQACAPDHRIRHAVSSEARSKPSSSHPVTPPAMILTGRPNSASRNAPRAAPLQ